MPSLAVSHTSPPVRKCVSVSSSAVPLSASPSTISACSMACPEDDDMQSDALCLSGIAEPLSARAPTAAAAAAASTWPEVLCAASSQTAAAAVADPLPLAAVVSAWAELDAASRQTTAAVSAAATPQSLLASAWPEMAYTVSRHPAAFVADTAWLAPTAQPELMYPVSRQTAAPSVELASLAAVAAAPWPELVCTSSRQHAASATRPAQPAATPSLYPEVAYTPLRQPACRTPTPAMQHHDTCVPVAVQEACRQAERLAMTTAAVGAPRSTGTGTPAWALLLAAEFQHLASTLQMLAKDTD